MKLEYQMRLGHSHTDRNHVAMQDVRKILHQIPYDCCLLALSAELSAGDGACCCKRRAVKSPQIIRHQKRTN